jgi:hypothetical protein
MRLSNKQKARLHQAAQAAGYTDKERYREVLQKEAGVRSSADLRITREGFIRVMAFFEGQCAGQLPRSSPGYWFGESMRADGTDSLRVAVERERTALGWSPETLEAFLAGPHLSAGKCPRLADATAYWLSRLLDAMKAMRKRDEGTKGRRDEGKPPFTAEIAEIAEKPPF